MPFLNHSLANSRENNPNGLGIMFTMGAGMLMVGTGLIIAIYGFFNTLGMFGVAGEPTDTVVHVGREAWGIIQLIGGSVLFIAGCNIFVGKYWAQMVGIGVSVLALIGGLMWIDAYPVWGISLVVLNIFIIWALSNHGNDMTF